MDEQENENMKEANDLIETLNNPNIIIAIYDGDQKGVMEIQNEFKNRIIGALKHSKYLMENWPVLQKNYDQLGKRTIKDEKLIERMKKMVVQQAEQFIQMKELVFDLLEINEKEE